MAVLRPFARKNLQSVSKSVNLTSRDSEPCPKLVHQILDKKEKVAIIYLLSTRFSPPFAGRPEKKTGGGKTPEGRPQEVA